MPIAPKNKVKLGHTFSLKQIDHLNLDIVSSFKTLLELQPDYIRLPCYWDEIQPTPKSIKLETIKLLLDNAATANQKIVLSLGVKAPRWPEFHVPSWTNMAEVDFKQNLSDYLTQLVDQLNSYANITHWQIENEPFDPIYPQKTRHSPELLREEIKLIRKIDPRPIVLTFWGNDLIDQSDIDAISHQIDVLGLDLYYQQFVTKKLGVSLYRQPTLSTKKLKNRLDAMQKPVWITELQAEPWEASEVEYQQINPNSISLKKVIRNYHQALTLPVEAIFFWGYEYWYWRHQQGDSSYINWYRQL